MRYLKNKSVYSITEKLELGGTSQPTQPQPPAGLGCPLNEEFLLYI